MGVDRKRVIVCARDEAFGKALCIVLSAHDCTRVDSLGAVTDDADLLVYRADDREEWDSVSKLAAVIPTLFLGTKEQLLPAVDSNCQGFLLDSAPLEEVNRAVESISAGGAVVPPDLLGTLLRHVVERRRQRERLAELSDLTDRELEVFRLAARGARKEEIGELLFISPATARTHLQNVYRKLGVHSQAELIALASRAGESYPEEER